MAATLNWGILGTGGIAEQFAGQIGAGGRAALVAVGSRGDDSAAAFARRFGGRPYGTYQALLEDADVEAVYVSLPNSLHREWTIRALESGKHVLCEKPLGANAAEAEEMFDTAERTGLRLVEAFMYRCQPAVARLIEMVHQGAVGRLKLIRTHFTFNRPADAEDIRYQPALAGGSLMDVGCYCVNFARALAGREPTEVHAIARMHPTGVDEYAAGTLRFGDDVLCAFTCGMTVEADRTTFVCGDEGHLTIESPWLGTRTFDLVTPGGRETIEAGSSTDLYALEAEAFADVVAGDARPWIDRDDTLGNMRVLDQLRKAAGLKF